LLCCERIWERNAAQLPRWGETRRDGWDGQLIVTAQMRRTRRLETEIGWFITQRSRYHCSAAPTEPTMAIVVPKAPGEPQRLDS
jgi:hypothetical protein